MEFKLGGLVKWSSQAAGSTKTKFGVVVFIVPAGLSQTEALRQFLANKPGNYNTATLGGGYTRDHESYLVFVKTSEKSMPKIYQPRVSSLSAYP